MIKLNVLKNASYLEVFSQICIINRRGGGNSLRSGNFGEMQLRQQRFVVRADVNSFRR